ncbi:hypothetical protein BJV82DRAFT_589146 [Fennellomyces sp. T-0311]|nr:hypothetical protein BJV82DRAFT_589146 [Fennellomyces sp. T-0311]
MPGIDNHFHYTVAFGETVHYTDQAASDAVLVLLASSDDFPALQSSTTAGKQAQEDREWQLIRPQDTDINEGLITSLSDDINSEDGKSEMGSAGWERLDIQKPLSFSEIASRAKDNAPIRNERFFVRPKQPKKSKKPIVVEAHSSLPEQEDTPSDYCESFYGFHNAVKEGRRITATRRTFALRRKRIKIEGVLSRRMRTIPEFLLAMRSVKKRPKRYPRTWKRNVMQPQRFAYIIMGAIILRTPIPLTLDGTVTIRINNYCRKAGR